MVSLQGNKMESLFFGMFPPPKYLAMPSVGVDISDHSVRFVEFKQKNGVKTLSKFGRYAIPDGTLSYGDIKDKNKIVEILAGVAKNRNISYVRCSLPEEKAYVFKTDVPLLNSEETRDNIAFQIEENVPLKVSDVIFDYVFLPPSEENVSSIEVVVSVFPLALVESYLDIYKSADMMPLSFEMEADALGRALIPKDDMDCYMIVDFGQQRTGLSVVERGVVQFASTVDVGGNILTEALQKQLGVSFEEAEKIKWGGVLVGNADNKEFFSTLLNSISSLSEEINKHYIYWHTHSDKKGRKPAPIKKIILCGGDSNLVGLPEHLSLLLKTKVELGNVWLNAFPLGEYVPEISFSESLSYASAVGLGLRG